LKRFRRISVITTLLTYFLIFVGGLVRVAGAGLGCPDWPKCFDRWIPPVHVSQLPPGMDPIEFNFVLAWIEYVNRLIGVVIGFFILLTTILALKYARHLPKIWVPSVLALVLVIFQGWLGGYVVATELQPVIVSLHMFLALVIVSLLLYVSQQAYHAEFGEQVERTVIPLGKPLVILLWIGAIIQIILGTQVREALEHMREQFPLLSAQQWFERITWMDSLHALVGVGMAVATWFIGFYFLKRSRTSNSLAYATTWGAMILVALQFIIGSFMMAIDLVAIAQLLHLVFASLYLGSLLIIFTEIRGAHASS
jgi:cytochrome c oxidase assembly protein subunit 15